MSENCYMGNGWVAINDSLMKFNASKTLFFAIRNDGDGWKLYGYETSSGVITKEMGVIGTGTLCDVVRSADALAVNALPLGGNLRQVRGDG